MANYFDQFDQPAQPAPNYFDQFDPGAKPQDEPGDTARGFKVALGQTVPILKGVAGLAGATAEKTFGEGGISTGLKNWGLKGFTEGMEKLQPLQRDTDELTTSWERAKGGDLGALIDWAQYGLGYAAGQAGEAVAMSLLGGAVGAAVAPQAAPVSAAGGAITGLVAKGAVKEAATALIRKAVVKEANDLMAKSAGKLTAEQAVQQATKAVAKNIGETSALLAYGGAQELGTIYPEAEAEALKKGEKLSGGDLARVWAAGLAAGGVEGLTDKLGLGAVTGKVKIPGIDSRLGGAAAMGLGGAATEGVTEAAQTAIERVGAGQQVLSPEGRNDIINSAALGALGGGAIGGGIGALRGPRRAASDAAFHRIASAETADEAIQAFEDTYIPPVVPPAFDAEGALNRMEGWMATDQSRFGGPAAPVPSIFQDGTIEPTAGGFTERRPATKPTVQAAAPITEPSAEIVPDEPFGDRLITLRDQLKDSRTRQQIRDTLGPEALGDVMYYASAADNAALPGITSDRMLRVAESIVSRALLKPVPNRVPTERITMQEPVQPGPTVSGIATPPESVFEVSPDGVVTPQVRAGVMTEPGRFVAPETPAATEPLALPEPAPYRAPTTPQEKAVAFTKAETDAANARASQAAAIPAQAQQQNERAAAVKRAATLETPTAMQLAMERARAGRVQEIEAAGKEAATSPANDRPEPTDAQKEAGNYKLGHVRVSGLDVSIENPKGSTRSSKAGAPEPWSVTMPATYGYIKGTRGSDGDHVDIFIGDKGENNRFWVINQNHVGGRRHDEHKVVTGVDSADEAVALYKASFADNFGDKVFGSVSGEFTPAALKARLPSMSRPQPVTGGSKTMKERAADMAQRSTQGAQDATQEISQQGSVQPERGGRDARGQTAEAGGGNRVQRPEGRAEPSGEPVRARGGPGQEQEAQGQEEGIKGPASATEPAAKAAPSEAVAPAASVQQPAAVVPGAAAPAVQADGVEAQAEPKQRLSNKVAFADNYKRLEGLTLERQVKITDTGKTGTLRMDAAKAMRRIDGRLDALKSLLKCLEGGS